MAQKLPTQTPDSSSSQKMIGDLQVFHQSADGASEANNCQSHPLGLVSAWRLCPQKTELPSAHSEPPSPSSYAHLAITQTRCKSDDI